MQAELGTVLSSGATLRGRCGATRSLALSGAFTGSTSGSPLSTVCRALRVIVSGRRGAPDSAEHPYRHLSAAATRGALALQLRDERQAERASHPLFPGALGSGTSRQETC